MTRYRARTREELDHDFLNFTSLPDIAHVRPRAFAKLLDLSEVTIVRRAKVGGHGFPPLTPVPGAKGHRFNVGAIRRFLATMQGGPVAAEQPVAGATVAPSAPAASTAPIPPRRGPGRPPKLAAVPSAKRPVGRPRKVRS